METIKAAIGLSPTTTADADATEPVAGEKGQGTGLEPYDAGNNPEACEAAERVRAEEDRGTSGDNVALEVSGGNEHTVDSNGTADDGEDAPTSGSKNEESSSTEHGHNINNNDEKANANGNSSSPANGKPKENPSAIPTAGGEKVGTQPVLGRESAAGIPAVADTTGKDDNAKQGGAALREASSANPDDGAAVNGIGSDAPPATAADNAHGNEGNKPAAANGSTTTASLPSATAAQTPTETARPEKPTSSAQKAMQDSNGSPVGSGLERKPSKMSRFVSRLKGRKSRGGEGEDTEKK